MLDNKVVFLFYAGAVACFVLAALQGSGKAPAMGRASMSRVAFVPLGLALFVFPHMWNAAAAGF